MVLPKETIAKGAPKTCPDCGIEIELGVHHSNAGYYIGAWCNCGPYCRESRYYKKKEQAERALKLDFYER